MPTNETRESNEEKGGEVDPVVLLTEKIAAARQAKEEAEKRRSERLNRVAVEADALSRELVASVVPDFAYIQYQDVGKMLPDFHTELAELTRREDAELIGVREQVQILEAEKARLNDLLQEAEVYEVTEGVEETRSRLGEIVQTLTLCERERTAIEEAKSRQRQALVVKWQAKAREQEAIAANPLGFAVERLLVQDKNGITPEEVLQRITTVREESKLQEAKRMRAEYERGVVAEYEKVVVRVARELADAGSVMLREYNFWVEALEDSVDPKKTAEQEGYLVRFMEYVGAYREIKSKRYGKLTWDRDAKIADDVRKATIVESNMRALFSQLPFAGVNGNIRELRDKLQASVNEAVNGAKFEVPSSPENAKPITVSGSIDGDQSFLTVLKIEDPVVIRDVRSKAQRLSSEAATTLARVNNTESNLKDLVQKKMLKYIADLPDLNPTNLFQ